MSIVFLQNHGLITTAKTYQEVQFLTEHVITTLEHYLGVDHRHYKYAEQLSNSLYQVSQEHQIVYQSHDQELMSLLQTHRSLFFLPAFCPDTLVYCGDKILELLDLNDQKSIQNYYETYRKLPNVIIHKNTIFCIAASIKKAREIEEVLKFHVLTLNACNTTEHMLPLTQGECNYLNNWDAEKYRKNI